MLGRAALAALAVTVLVPAPALAARAKLDVVTANVAFGKGSQDRVERLFRSLPGRTDVVFLQEARDVNISKRMIGDRWAIRQDAAAPETRGSAVVVRKGRAVAGVGPLTLTPAVRASTCRDHPNGGVGLRYIASVPLQLARNGRTIRVASLHMPPIRCDYPGGPYAETAENVVAFANAFAEPLILGADWNKTVDDDPNAIGARANLMPRGLDTGLRIDGFMLERKPAIKAGQPKRLPGFGSDHQPVIVRAKVQ